MSQPYTTNEVYEQHWDRYLLYCRAEGTRPSFSDFMVWCDENVPEVTYED